MRLRLPSASITRNVFAEGLSVGVLNHAYLTSGGGNSLTVGSLHSTFNDVLF